MANANPTKHSRLDIRRARQNWLRYAKVQFGVRGKKQVLWNLAAEAIGVPAPKSKDDGYDVLRRFYIGDPHPERELPAVAKSKLEAKRERKAVFAQANSDAFLRSFEWRKLRMEVLTERGARCECCGATPSNGIVINVDHIKPRRRYPELALVKANLQVLCEVCNHGKGSWDETDWRNDSHKSGESSADSPVTRSGDGDGQMARAFPRLVKVKQA